MTQPPEASTLSHVVAAQLSCRGCHLRANGPVPVFVPLHVPTPVGLLVMPRPYSDVATPAADPRRRALVDRLPLVADFAATYLTSCWSDPGSEIPSQSINACRRHRSAEMAAVSPRVVVTLGAAACVEYTGQTLDAGLGQGWIHPLGATVVPLGDDPEQWVEEHLSLIAAYCGQFEVQYDVL